MEIDHDEKILHEIEAELHVDIYPGTEIMIDVGSHHFVKSKTGSDRVLVPQPSSDPADPLNWTPLWKFSVNTMAAVITFIQGLGLLAIAPMTPYLIEAFDTDLFGVVRFTGITILVLGFSNFLWVPLQSTFGRRPVLLLTTLICLVSNIWRAKATSYSSFMGACVLNGIGGAPAETAQPTIISDIMFLHQRGAYNTLYFSAYFCAFYMGPIIAGPMAFHSNWRNFWWLNVALDGVIFVMIMFLLPETLYHRVYATEMPSHSSLEGKDLSQNVENLDNIKPTDKKPDVAAVHAEVVGSSLVPVKTADRDPNLGKGRPSPQQFKLFQPNRNWMKSILEGWINPWKLFLFPIVQISGIIIAWSASCFLAVNVTQSQNFAAPPYNYSSQTIGFMNFAVLVGTMIGLLTNGKLSDWVADIATKRNRGVREPEMRLPALIPYVGIMMIGNFVVAFGMEQKWDWKPIVIVGYTCIGIQVAAIPAIVSTYAVDSYKPATGSTFVIIAMIKNLWGYGYSEILTPWTLKSGFVPPIIVNMSILIFWCALTIPFYFYGKRTRKWTRNSSVHKL